MSWFDSILSPLMVAVAWMMVQFHTALTTLGLSPTSGVTWALSIVGLVIVIRILLIPLFVKQIKASRGMQLLAPEMQVIQKKYKGKTDPASREAMSRETMELYRKHGTNPFSSCLPILAQSPIFFALFRVLYSLPQVEAGTYAGGAKESIGPLTQELAAQANAATLFGAQISDSFLGSSDPQVKIVTVGLILLMSATTFTTQRQLTQKNMPASAMTGPMAQQQKMLLYVLPLVFAISGVNFPIGVLIYWSTTNIWSMGQQFYVIRRNPTPGSEAERMLKERRARKAAARGIVLEEEQPVVEEKPRGQRQQPKRKDRAKPATAPGAGGGAGTPGVAGATSSDGAGSGGAGSGAAEDAAAAGSGADESSAAALPVEGSAVKGTPGKGSSPKSAAPKGAAAKGAPAKGAGAKGAAPKGAGAKGAAAKAAVDPGARSTGGTAKPKWSGKGGGGTTSPRPTTRPKGPQQPRAPKK